MKRIGNLTLYASSNTGVVKIKDERGSVKCPCGRKNGEKKWGQTTINSPGQRIAQQAPRPDRLLPRRRFVTGAATGGGPALTVSRRAKRGAACRVKVPGG
jgi:hypothetical protein